MRQNYNKRSIIPFDHQTTSFSRLRPVLSLLGLISNSISQKYTMTIPGLPHCQEKLRKMTKVRKSQVKLGV